MGLDNSGQAKSFEELAAMESLEETKETPAVEVVAEEATAEEAVAETTEEVTAETDTGGVTEEVTDNTTEKTEE